MNYQHLREKIQHWPKYPGCVHIERSPLIHDGFPGNFNLSFTEEPWLREYGCYVDMDHDYLFSTVQSCIRPLDFPLLKTDNASKYLGVFEMADPGGVLSLKERPDYIALQRWQVKSLLDFLQDCGIPPASIHPSYCPGGRIEAVSEGRYAFDFIVPEDKLSRDRFLEAGIPEENLIADPTRATFLCVYLNRPTGWGYRNEVHLNIGSKEKPVLLDLATIEYFLWKPRFAGDDTSSKNIVGIEELDDGISLCAMGLERLCMAANSLKRVQNVDYLQPFYAELKHTGSEDACAGESIRAAHRICSDILKYSCILGKNKRNKFRQILANIPLSFPVEQIRELLMIHAASQPWHPELEAGIEPTLERIETYRRGRFRKIYK